MAGIWSFKWYDPTQDLRPPIWLESIGVPVPNPNTLLPYVISDASNGRRVRFRSLLGASGPTYAPVSQDIPFNPRSHLEFVNVNDAEVDLRVLFTADSSTLLWSQLEDLPYRFNPRRGIGMLEVTNPSGAVRFLNCTCISGFKIDESTLQEKSVEAVLSFYANDPFWYSEWHTLPYQFLDNKIGQLPMLPSILSRGPNDTISLFPITNKGDANGDCVFIIGGPYGNPLLTNASLTIPPTALEPIPTIYKLDLSNNGGLDMVLRNPTTVDFINKNIIAPYKNPPYRISNSPGLLTNDSTFWTIQHGVNDVYINILNADINTSVTIIYRDTYSTMI